MECDVLIVGGGTGAVAAALATTRYGLRTIVTEETRWIGGQLTSQIVPPDEHPWIEGFGCTATYRRYRELVRAYYQAFTPLTAAARHNARLNPGTGWVSRLCHEPRIGHAVLQQMLQPAYTAGLLRVLPRLKPHSAEVDGDQVKGVRFVHLDDGSFMHISAKFVLDATELGDLLPLTGTEYVVGAESKSETGEPNAVEGPVEWDNVQGITWCFALGHDHDAENAGSDIRLIEKPNDYEYWRAYKPPFWPGPLLGFQVLHAHTGESRELPLYGRKPGDWYALFPYRQIIEPSMFETSAPLDPVTVVNWPQNDYFEATIMDVDPLPTGDSIPEGFEVPGAMGPESARRLGRAKDLSATLLYWLQTEAPRHDDQGLGYKGVYARPDVTETADGFAMYPYIREARRIKAEYVVKEQDVAAYTNPGVDRAPSFADSVGVGSYRIDLHPSTNGANTIDTSTLPFEIPLRSLVPVRMKNLVPACKNLGVTHITNGCYRLHPVEWNIGESAGHLAAHCLEKGVPPQGVTASKDHIETFQKRLVMAGIELRWPELKAL